MFSKSIIETDDFLDMPMPTKALYFLLGMEADDEGFVSPKRVMRLYGGNEDDLKILIAKNFVIYFKSGVVVITDWRENNYLDKNRIKETRYKAEKSLLSLKSNKYAMLNKCLTDVQPVENSIEEKRGEERSIEENILFSNENDDSEKKSNEEELVEELEYEYEPKTQSVKPKDVVNYFFRLKGWVNKDKEFYKKNKIIYARYTRPAKELLILCDYDLNEAKECLDKIKKWAESHNLGWSIETVFKKWYELDYLKEKEKKPYIDGRRAFKKENGKWYLIEKNGEIKEYVGNLNNIKYE